MYQHAKPLTVLWPSLPGMFLHLKAKHLCEWSFCKLVLKSCIYVRRMKCEYLLTCCFQKEDK